MLVAFLSAVVAALAVLAVICVIFAVRSRNSSTSVGASKAVRQLRNVVGAHSHDGEDSRRRGQTGEVTVNSSDAVATQKLSDGMTRRFFGFSVLGGAVFATLGIKLWSMQVLGGSDYADAAEKNLYTTVNTPAPRGNIYDMFGEPLAVNRACQTVLADPDVADNRDVVRLLSTVLGLPVNVVTQRINDTSAGAQSLRVIAQDARLRDVAFIAEHADAFPGITVEERFDREYPYGALAAHALGYTSEPSEEQLEQQIDGREILAIDMVGTSGVEGAYDSLLSGDHGERLVMVDAEGRVVSVMSETEATKGSDIYLTLDARAQYVADSTLAKLIAPYGVIGEATGTSGAVVALDVRDGSVLVMSSYPTFDPADFTGSFSEELWELYQDDAAYHPLTNRVISGQFPAASTFKAFSSLAGLEYGIATEQSSWTCTGEWDGFKSGTVQKCWNHDGHGTLDLHGGIVHSCDVVFYEIAKGFYDRGPNETGELSETALQDYLKQFGFGSQTGIDIGGESAGLVPTPEWKAETYRNLPSEIPWRGGDYTNMIIGQGDVQVTPLQIAAGYAGVATGTIMKPHLLKEVRNSEGDVVVSYTPEVARTPDVNEEHLSYVRDSLHDMILEGETVSKLFEEEGIDAAGKSGTGERADEGDTAWFVAYAPYDDPEYVVACVVEQGGGGSDTAAPVVAKVMGELMRSQEGTSNVKVKRVSASTGKSVEYDYSSAGRTD